MVRTRRQTQQKVVKMSNDVPFAEVVVVGEAATEAALSGARLAAEVPGARVAHRFGPNVAILVGDESDEPPRSTTDLSTVDLAALTPTERLGVQAAALRQSAEWQEAKRNRPRQGEEWDGRDAVWIPGKRSRRRPSTPARPV